MKQIADKLAQYGRHGDTHIGHITSGEVDVPVDILNNSSLLQTILGKEFERNNTSMERYTVGTIENSINPYTGLMEFFGGFGGFVGGIVGGAAKAVGSVVSGATKAVSSVVEKLDPGEMLGGGILGNIASLGLGLGFKGLSGYIAGPAFSHIGTFKALENLSTTKDIFGSSTIAGFLAKKGGSNVIKDTIANIAKGQTIKAATDIVAKPGEKKESQSIMDFAAKKALDLGGKYFEKKMTEAEEQEQIDLERARSQGYGAFGGYEMKDPKIAAAEAGHYLGEAIDRYSGSQIYYGNFQGAPDAKPLYDDQTEVILAALQSIAKDEPDDPLKNFEFLTAKDYERQQENAFQPTRIG